MNTENDEILENEEITEEASEELSEEVSEESEEVSEESEEVSEEITEEASEEITEEASEEITEEASEESQTVLYDSIDYTSHFQALESLGYIQIVFLGTFLIYFVLVLVYKFIKSFF